jgi:septum formation protein
MSKSELHVCSQSPRRHSILNEFDVPFNIAPNKLQVEPNPKRNETPIEYSARMACSKLFASSKNITGSILAVDTVVSINGDILGKPSSRDDAFSMLKRLNGKSHLVTSTAVFLPQNEHDVTFCIDYANVVFKRVSESVLIRYIDQFNPFDKAGSYGVQDNPPFLEKVDGDFYTVMGLPINRLLKLLKSYGIVK